MTPTLSELHGRRALVSGAASGIGAAIVRKLREAGATVAGLDVSPDIGSDCDLVADLTDAHQLDAAFALLERIGLPDILVHAAAITTPGGVLDVDPERWLRIYDVNVVGAVRLMRRCVPAMKERGNGAVVLMSSINADFATPTQAPYAASKAALNNLMKTAALQLAPDGIRVNSIAPASVDTPAMRASLANRPDAEQARLANMQRHPIARWGTSEEVAELTLFLVSDRSSWITGAVHRIDGGASVTRR